MDAAPSAHMTEEEYLEYDFTHEGRHELVNGELLAMAGGSEAHALAIANMIGILTVALRGSPCRVYSSDLRVRIDETGLYGYPDLTVVCGRAELAPTRPPTLLNPKVVVEVLSESTEGYDRGAKAAHYRQRASVEAIVLVATRERRVEVLTRNADGSWTLREAAGEAGEVPLAPLGVTLPLEAVYAGFDQLAVAEEPPAAT